MRWSGATGAIARCKRVSTGCGRKRRSVPAWPWICGVKPKPKGVNKLSPHCIVHGLDKPGGFTTVSRKEERTDASRATRTRPQQKGQKGDAALDESHDHAKAQEHPTVQGMS